MNTEGLARLIELPREDIFAALGSRPEGLTSDEVRERAARFGSNAIAETRGPGLVRRLGGQFVHLFALLLWAGSILAILAGEVTLAAAIAAVVVINGLFGFWQENRAQRAVAALRRLLPESALLVRGGREQSVPAPELVPGDVIVVGEGDRISADSCLVDSVDLRVDQSALTGESHPVHKAPGPESGLDRVADAHSLILAGSTVTSAASATVSAGATTVVFLAIVILQVGNAFACRTERTSAFARGLLSNRFLLLGVLFELLFAAALIYTPPFQRLFGTAALDPRWWLVLAAFIGPVFAVEAIRKLLLRRRSRDQGGRQTPTRRSAPG